MAAGSYSGMSSSRIRYVQEAKSLERNIAISFDLFDADRHDRYIIYILLSVCMYVCIGMFDIPYKLLMTKIS